MAFDGHLYNKFIEGLVNGEFNWNTHAVHAALTTSGEVPNQDNDKYWTDAVGSEVAAGGGYSTNGVALTSKSFTYTTATNKYALTCANPSWAGFSQTFRNVHFVDRNAGSDALRLMVGFQANNVDITGGGGTLTLVLDAAGLVEWTME